MPGDVKALTQETMEFGILNECRPAMVCLGVHAGAGIGLLPGGLLGDRFGRKKVLPASLALFGLGSLACAYSPPPGAFIAAFVVLGLSDAFVVLLSLPVLTVLFSETERPLAVGVWAAANFLALPIGPILGG